ncbi:hypothetical protein ACOCEA_03390 [Maribacter sp. CXY002]|uniref:hypothetical protein n=1 Tax=Maribacter luteocoastalis TaxID=3407671 RepID=UPI003B66B49B
MLLLLSICNAFALTNRITIKSTNKNTVVTIVKYDCYQEKENEDNQQDNHLANHELTKKAFYHLSKYNLSKLLYKGLKRKNNPPTFR